MYGHWMAAALCCGPGAVLSHESAAALWEIRPRKRSEIEVSVPLGARRRHAGIVVHRRVALNAGEITRSHGIPVTSPTCTLIDLAPRLDQRHLERAINEADKRDLTDPEALRAALDAVVGPPTRPPRSCARTARSPHVRPHRVRARTPFPAARARRAGLPRPETGRRVERIQSRLLLAGPGPGRRDGRAALPPHSRPQARRPPARPGACRGGPDAAALHPRPDHAGSAPTSRPRWPPSPVAWATFSPGRSRV